MNIVPRNLLVANQQITALSFIKQSIVRSKSTKIQEFKGSEPTHFYPNTDVGMAERNSKGKIKADPVDPIQKPYPPFPDGKNPTTGEVGGPTGPEPTRFGDWERKGRVSDF